MRFKNPYLIHTNKRMKRKNGGNQNKENHEDVNMEDLLDSRVKNKNILEILQNQDKAKQE